jgi:cytochrome P450
VYEEPQEFRPERFLGRNPDTFAWIPFGGGIRRCIGAALAQAEIAEVLRVVLPRVTLRASRAHLDPVVMRGITLVPRHGTHVEVTARTRPTSTDAARRSGAACPHAAQHREAPDRAR